MVWHHRRVERYDNIFPNGELVLKVVNLNQLVGRVLTCFQPKEFSVAAHKVLAHKQYCAVDVTGYSHEEGGIESLGLSDSMSYHKFRKAVTISGLKKSLKCYWKEEEPSEDKESE